MLTFTPYQRWKHEHAIHHATAGDLDRRGVGDVYTMTLEEYLAAPWWKKAGYRIMSNPIAMFLMGSPVIFVLVERVPLAKGRRELASAWWKDLPLAAVIIGLSLAWQNRRRGAAAPRSSFVPDHRMDVARVAIRVS